MNYLKITKYIIGLFLFIFFNLSCEKKIDWYLNFSDNQYLIVDGIITNELIHQEIKLSLSKKGLNDMEEFPLDAEVSVFDGVETYQFHLNDTHSGTYISDSLFAGVLDKTYTLEIAYNGNTYSAKAEMFPVAISNPLTYKQIPDSNQYYINSEIVRFNPDEATMIEVYLDWSNVEGYEALNEQETKARLFYYNLKTIDVNQIFAPEHEIILFPAGTFMQQKKYSLSPSHEKFIRSMLIETQWSGSNFDIEEGNVYTNLTAGALGFFGACSVVTYSTTVH